LVGKEGGGDVADAWIKKLTGDMAKIMNRGSFWSLVGKEGGGVILDKWMTILTGDNAKILKSGSFLSLIGTDAGDAKATKWFNELEGTAPNVMRTNGFWSLVAHQGGCVEVHACVDQLGSDLFCRMNRDQVWSYVAKRGASALIACKNRWQDREFRLILKQGDFWSFLKVNRNNLADNLLASWIPKLTGAALSHDFWRVLGHSGGDEYLTQNYKGTMTLREIRAMKNAFFGKRNDLHSASTPAHICRRRVLAR
jgi:hypothetical protein